MKARGSAEGSRYSGDDFGDAMDRLFEARFPSQYLSLYPEWERANRFGLVDGNVVSCWCCEGTRLFWLGGAAECFPWQGCCEWANFLTSAAVEYTTEGKLVTQGSSHAIRPVIPLLQ
jgi:hypothetical protein